MATFLKEFFVSIDERWQEIDLLITRARDVKENDEELYNVLCRAVTILLISHLEGFTKDLVKNVIHDLNNHCNFSSLPEVIKRTYCKQYLGTNQSGKNSGYDSKVTRLIEKFEEIGCKISNEPFFFTSNRNPSANVIKTVFENFGIANVFFHLNKSDLEEMFSISHSEIQKKILSLETYAKTGLESFPYDLTGEEYGLIKIESRSKTLWEEFLEQINQKRHSVAHGNVFTNTADIEELDKDKSKILLTQYALIVILASKITKGVPTYTS